MSGRVAKRALAAVLPYPFAVFRRLWWRLPRGCERRNV